MYKENFTFESENGVYTWKNRNIKVEFSNPRIQPHHESFLKDTDDILYYYYNMRVSRYAWIDGEYEWKIVAEANAYDAPAVTYFCALIEEALYYLDKFDERWEVFGYESGDKAYSKTLKTGGFINEDYYRIVKTMSPDKCITSYSVFVGSGIGGENFIGVNIGCLNERDMRALLECVEGFIRYSIDNENEKIRKSYRISSKKFKHVDGRIYEYCTRGDEIDFNKIEEIYSVGDKLDDVTVAVFEDDFIRDSDYHKLTISSVTDEGITFHDGTYLLFGDITYMCAFPSEELLCYGPTEIAADFYERLSASEREDFSSLSEEELFEKYGEAILGRTAMCRDEHNLPILAERTEENYHANVYENIRRIIPMIKGMIKKN